MKSKKLLLFYLVILCVVIITMVLLRPPKPAPILTRDYPEIQKEGVLYVTTEYNKEGYYIAGDTIEGFHYELSQIISDISGLEVHIQLEMSLTESFKALNSNQTDIIARNIPVTTENRENYLFTDPIIFNKQVLVQRKTEENQGIEPIRNQLDLGGKTIHIPQDSPARLRLYNLAEEIGDSIVVEENPLYSTEQLLILVAKGEIEYAVCDYQTSLKYLDQFPEIDIQTDISFTQLQSWVLRKDSPVLLDSLNSWFRQIRENGAYDLIYKRYYNK